MQRKRLTASHLPPDRHKISVTTFTDNLFDGHLHLNNVLWDAKQCFYWKSRKRKYRNLRLLLFFFSSSFFLFFFFFAKLSGFVWKTRVVQRFLSLMHTVFFHYSNGTIKSSKPNNWQARCFLNMAFQSLENFGMRLVTWLWAEQGLLRPCQVTWRVPLIFVNYIDE